MAGRVVGTVNGPGGNPLPGVLVTLTTETGASFVEVTGSMGEFAFRDIPAGLCQFVAVLPGYEDRSIENVRVVAGEETSFEMSLQIARISESVVIEGVAPDTVANEPEEAVTLTPEQLDALPLPSDRFQESFPLVPGVVRDPEGRLSFNGARPSQSTLLVNGANVTDPVTGEFAVELPLKAIKAVEVNNLPYSAEYGRVTGAVAKIETRGGTDEWDVDYGNMWPSFNFRDGTIKGVRSFVPQVQISGPIKKGKAWFSQGLAYRFVRSRAYDVATGEDERVLESYDSFTQLDFRFAEKHHLTTTFSFFPLEVDNLGLNALVTANATPDFNSKGWNFAVSQRSFFSRTFIETIVAVKTFDVAVGPKSHGPSRLTPEGLRDNYFNELDRDSLRFEVASSCTHAPSDFFGEHIMKIGGNVSYTSFTGTDMGRPVEFLGNGGSVIQRVEYLGDPTVSGEDVQVSAYVQDRWRLTDRLGFDIGLRYDYDRLVSEHQLAPRVSTAFALDQKGRTVIKAGWGIFYDRVLLYADRFDRFQRRVERNFGADGSPEGPSLVFAPRVADEGLDMPRSTTWNVALSQVLAKDLQLRVNYRERRGSKELIVDRVENGASGAMLLSSRGKSLSRELDVTLRVKRERNELFISYARARTTGDLNDFAALYQDLRTPLFLANERSLFRHDVPHRALFWGIWHIKGDITVSPGVEWRSGFPYSVFSEAYVPLGERNRGGRFPNFLSVDVRVMKGLTVKGRKIRVGFQIFNLASHYNPRDVVSNLASSRFGEFLNSVDMGFSFRFSFGP